MTLKHLKSITALTVCLMLFASVLAVPIRRKPGIHIPEYYMPTDRDNPALWGGQPRYALNRAAAAPGEYSISDIPRTGSIEYPLVLVEFSDLHFTKDAETLRKHYECIFNEHGYSDSVKYIHNGITYSAANGSVADYFWDMSYGQFNPTFNIIGPITLPKSYVYYGSGKYDNVEALVREVCDSIITHNHANLSGYARNGVIDQITIIYAGRGENYEGADPNTIWPQASIVYFSGNDAVVYGKGIRQIKYACSSELYWDSDSIMDGIGTICHEFSHTLGLPDFYNTDANADTKKNVAMGQWSLMDYGCYDDGGFSPVGYTAFERYSLGWLDLEEITDPGTYNLNFIARKPNPEQEIHVAYRLSTGNDDQFLILENHIKNGWYRYHPARGLMVTTVDYDRSKWTSNKLNNGTNKRYRILPADNDYDMISQSGDLFPYTWTDSLGTHVTDSITTRGEPQLKAGSSYPPLSIYNISRNGSVITFTVGYDMPSKVENVKPDETTVTVYDISGKPVLKTTTSDPEHVTPPGPGIWIIKYGNKTRKVRL